MKESEKITYWMRIKNYMQKNFPNIASLIVKSFQYIGKESIFDHGRTFVNFSLYLATLVALIAGIITILNFNTKFKENAVDYIVVSNDSNKTNIAEATRLSFEKEELGKTIDLLNLVLVTGGSVVVFVSILAVLQVRKWDTQQLNAQKNLSAAENSFKEATAKYGDIEKYQKWLYDIMEFFTIYARGLSKFYSHNYTDAIRQFNYVIHFVNEKMTLRDADRSAFLDDVYFHLGRSYFKQLNLKDESKNEQNRIRLEKALESFEKAQKIFFQNNEPNFSSGNNSRANCAIILAYLSGLEHDKAKKKNYVERCLEYIYEVENYLENKVYHNTIDDNPRESIAPLYNIGCAYAVLYKYEQDLIEKVGYRLKALNYAEKSYKEYEVVNQEYFLNDKDWDVFTSGVSHEEDRNDFAEKIGPFFAKKNSRWEIAKIWMELYDNTGFGKYKDRAEGLLQKCLETHLVTQNDILKSSTIANLKTNEWKKHLFETFA